MSADPRPLWRAGVLTWPRRVRERGPVKGECHRVSDQGAALAFRRRQSGPLSLLSLPTSRMRGAVPLASSKDSK